MTAHESHRTAGGHPAPPDHPEQIKVIVLWGTTAVVILVILLVWLRTFFFVVRNETIQKNYLSAPNPKIEELHASEQALLTSYGWVDRQKGIVHIPIDRAMELMVRESGQASGGRTVEPGSAVTGTPPSGTRP